MKAHYLVAAVALWSLHAVVTIAQTVDVIEYYNASQDHYFISSLQPDINALDSGHFPGWARTGLTFKAYPTATANASPVCRFYIPPAYGDSHFYSASPTECAQVLAKFPFFAYESPNVMYIDLPDPTTGACPVGDIPVYRVWDHRVDTNHRYTTDLAIRAQMIAKGWVAEGYGPDSTKHRQATAQEWNLKTADTENPFQHRVLQQNRPGAVICIGRKCADEVRVLSALPHKLSGLGHSEDGSRHAGRLLAPSRRRETRIT